MLRGKCAVCDLRSCWLRVMREDEPFEWLVLLLVVSRTSRFEAARTGFWSPCGSPGGGRADILENEMTQRYTEVEDSIAYREIKALVGRLQRTKMNAALSNGYRSRRHCLWTGCRLTMMPCDGKGLITHPLVLPYPIPILIPHELRRIFTVCAHKRSCEKCEKITFRPIFWLDSLTLTHPHTRIHIHHKIHRLKIKREPLRQYALQQDNRGHKHTTEQT